MHRTPLRAFTIAVAFGSLACGGSATEPTSSEQVALQRAEAEWNAAGVQSYDFDLVTSFAAAHDSVQVQVRNDQVTQSTSYLPGRTTTGKAIPDLFASVDTAIVSGLKVDVSYDPQLGYPATGTISAQYNTPAGPSSWRVVNFTPVP